MEAIRGTESSWSWSEVVLRHREFLITCVEPDFGLVEKLNATDVLSDVDKARITAENIVYDRNTKLLERIHERDRYDAFIEALERSSQTHVVNYLKKNGIYAFDDDWPLLDRERSILRANQETLIEILEVQDLVIRLYSAGVINSMQREFISSKKPSYKKNRALLDILSRRSIRDYKKTIRCLHETKQSHIAQILEEGGVVMRVHAVIPDDRTEDEIISQFSSILGNRSPEESRRILEGTLNNVIAMKKGKSIIVYVYCRTIVELLKWKELKTSGKLVTVLQKLFIDVLFLSKCTEVTAENPKNVVVSPFTEIHQIEKMTATVNEEEFDKSEKCFSDISPSGEKRTKEVLLSEVDRLWQLGMEAKEEEKERKVKDTPGEQSSIIRIKYRQIANNLSCLGDIVADMYQESKLTPMEFEEIQLLNSTPLRANEELLHIITNKPRDVYQHFLTLLKKTNQEQLYQILATEDEQNVDWLRSVYQEIIGLRRNFHWLSEQMDSDSGFVTLLYQYKVLSTREMESILSTKDHFRKNEMLLSLIERKSPQDFKSFIKALEETNQYHIVSRVKGGKGRSDEKEIRHYGALTFPRRAIQRPILHGVRTVAHSMSCISLQETSSEAQPDRNTKRMSHDRQFQRRFNYNRLEIHPLKNEFFTKTAWMFVNSAKSRMTPTIEECFKTLLQESLEEKFQLINKDKEKLKELKHWKTKAETNSMKILELRKELESLKRQLENKESKGNQIEKDQAAKDDAGNIWLDKMKLTLANNHQFLVENMKSNPLVSLLHSKRCITDEQKYVINNQPNDFYRNSEILQWMRSSIKQPGIFWSNVLECLRESDQSSIGDILDNGGMTVMSKITSSLAHAKFQESLAAKEKVVVEKLNKLDKVRSEIEDGIHIIPFCRQDSDAIIVWFWCHSQKALQNLQKMQYSLSSSNSKLKNLFAELSRETSASLFSVPSSSSSSILIPYKFSPRIYDESVTKTADIEEYRRKLRTNLQTSRPKKAVQSMMRGLAILQDELFVVFDRSSEVRVDDKTSRNFLRNVTIKDMLDPNDIVSCTINKCLYIFTKTDNKTWCILAVDTIGNLLWKLSAGGDWGRLSVSPSSNIIFTVFDNDKVIEISPKGKVLQEIKLSIECPRHAVQLESGHFLVGYGNHGGLCIVDQTGNVITSPDEQYLQLAKPLMCPTCVAVVKEGTIYVLDECKGRVVLLTADLKYQKELFSKSQKLTSPKRMCIDESLGCLFVVENDITKGNSFISSYSIESSIGDKNIVGVAELHSARVSERKTTSV